MITKKIPAGIYRNPYISDKITSLLKINKNTEKLYIEDNQKQLDLFENVVCKDLVDRVRDLKQKQVYKNYEDFLNRYSIEDYIKDQNNLYDEYFSQRPVYEEPFLFGLVAEVDLNAQCSMLTLESVERPL